MRYKGGDADLVWMNMSSRLTIPSANNVLSAAPTRSSLLCQLHLSKHPEAVPIVLYVSLLTLPGEERRRHTLGWQAVSMPLNPALTACKTRSVVRSFFHAVPYMIGGMRAILVAIAAIATGSLTTETKMKCQLVEVRGGGRPPGPYCMYNGNLQVHLQMKHSKAGQEPCSTLYPASK